MVNTYRCPVNPRLSVVSMETYFQYFCMSYSLWGVRAVLTNSPNSIPPERVFSILNDPFDDDQDRSLADY